MRRTCFGCINKLNKHIRCVYEKLFIKEKANRNNKAYFKTKKNIQSEAKDRKFFQQEIRNNIAILFAGQYSIHHVTGHIIGNISRREFCNLALVNPVSVVLWSVGPLLRCAQKTDMNEDGPRRGITFQCGLARESYGFEGKDLTALKDLACSFLDQKVLQRKLFLQLPCVFLCVDSRHIEQPSASHVVIAVCDCLCCVIAVRNVCTSRESDFLC